MRQKPNFNNMLLGRRHVRRGASKLMQRKWKEISPNKKQFMRTILPDSDKDGVPNKFDCRPFNPRRQDDNQSKMNVYVAKGEDREVIVIKATSLGDAKMKFLKEYNKDLPRNQWETDIWDIWEIEEADIW